MAQKAFDRAKVKVKAWEDQLTPLEIAKLLESDQSLLFSIAPLLKSGQRPAGYIREEWGEDAHYFTAARDARNLLVVFTALRGNIGVSISTFLQCLRDDAYDVVLLRDRGDLHYTRGISGLGDALGIARRIEELRAQSAISGLSRSVAVWVGFQPCASVRC